MGFESVIFLLIAAAMCLITRISCNSEVNILRQWRLVLNDPNNVLQSWDPTLVNPCTWLHVTCNNENSVARLDLGSAGLSGPLIPQLAQLSHLQYLELYNNNLSGNIPSDIGNLKNLVSLDLHHNHLSGPIPSSIGNLVSLRFLNLNSNKLSGTIPMKVIQLIGYGNLMIMNVTREFISRNSSNLYGITSSEELAKVLEGDELISQTFLIIASYQLI